MSDELALRCDGARQALRLALGAARLHPRDPGRHGHGARRPERRRQDHPAAARRRPDAGRRRATSACSAALAAARRRAAPRRARLRRAGAPALQGLHDRRDAQARSQAQSDLGRRVRARAHRALGLAARPEGRQALGRPAGAGRAHARARQATRICSLLDEPVASLDPLARREFLQSVMEAVAESGMTVMLSSHIVADLERVCDHLVILSTARGAARRRDRGASSPSHRVLTGPRADPAAVARVHEVIRASHTDAPDDVARARQRPRLRLLLGAARGRPRGDRARVPRLRRRAAVAPLHRSSRSAGGVVIWVAWRQQRVETLIVGRHARADRRAAHPDRDRDGLALRPRRALGVRGGERRRRLPAGDPAFTGALRRDREPDPLAQPHSRRHRHRRWRRRCCSSSRAGRTGSPGPRASRAGAGSTVKLGMAVLAAVLAALAMTAARDVVADAARPPPRPLRDNVFDFEGIVGVGYVLFALGLVARHRRSSGGGPCPR